MKFMNASILPVAGPVQCRFHVVCYYAPAKGELSDDAVWRLSVCLSRTSGLSREQTGYED